MGRPSLAVVIVARLLVGGGGGGFSVVIGVVVAVVVGLTNPIPVCRLRSSRMGVFGSGRPELEPGGDVGMEVFPSCSCSGCGGGRAGATMLYELPDRLWAGRLGGGGAGAAPLPPPLLLRLLAAALMRRLSVRERVESSEDRGGSLSLSLSSSALLLPPLALTMA